VGRGGTTERVISIREQIETDIRTWDAIEEHRTGTQGDADTAAWLIDELLAAGLHPQAQTKPFFRRVPMRCEVMAADQRALGVPLFDGGFTTDGIVAPLTTVRDRTEGIAVVEFTPFAKDSSNESLERARRSVRVEAVVAIARGAGVKPGLALVNTEDWSMPFGPPVLQVASSHRNWLLDAAAAGVEARFDAAIRLEETTISNVRATIPGKRRRLAPLVVMTPRSGWWRSTSERGGGIAAWLACARAFAARPPERTVIFTANSGHELGHVGLDLFLDAEPDLAAGAATWLHFGANFAATGARTRIQASGAELLDELRRALDQEGAPADDTTALSARPLGEARNIADAGGRYLSILASNPLFHHPDDRWPTAVDLDRTVRTVTALVNLAERLARA
jgi:hypothetical protein